MTQYLRPNRDVQNPSTWYDSVNDGTLWDALSESVRDDARYIYSQANMLGLCEVGLSAVNSPGVTTGHILRYTLLRTVANKNYTMVVSLMQGAAVIASWTHANPATSFTLFAQTLTTAQAGAITDYSALSVRFDVTVASGGGGLMQVSWATMEVPGNASDNLTASAITTAAPALEVPTLRQTQVLAAVSLTAPVPVLEASTLSETSITVVRVTYLALQMPPAAPTDSLLSVGITAGAPALEAAVIGQAHVLASAPITGGTPLVDAAVFTQIHALTAVTLVTGAPALGTPSMSGIVDLAANDLTAGIPALALPWPKPMR